VEAVFFDGKLLTSQVLATIRARAAEDLRGFSRAQARKVYFQGLLQENRAKKCRGRQWRTSRHFQPRLPGSVVGEASMDWITEGNKITKDNDL